MERSHAPGAAGQGACYGVSAAARGSTAGSRARDDWAAGRAAAIRGSGGVARASTVTPVGVSLLPPGDDDGEGWRAVGRLKRSVSFSAFELGHVLARTRIDA